MLGPTRIGLLCRREKALLQSGCSLRGRAPAPGGATHSPLTLQVTLRRVGGQGFDLELASWLPGEGPRGAEKAGLGPGGSASYRLRDSDHSQALVSSSATVPYTGAGGKFQMLVTVLCKLGMASPRRPEVIPGTISGMPKPPCPQMSSPLAYQMPAAPTIRSSLLGYSGDSR